MPNISGFPVHTHNTPGANIAVLNNPALIVAATNTGSTVNTSQKWPIAGWTKPVDVTETKVQIIWRTAGMFAKFGINIGDNSVSLSTVITFRKNAADTALAVTVASGATGVFEDTSNLVDVVPGDKFNIQSVPGGGSTGTFIPRVIWVQFFSYNRDETVSRLANSSGNFTLTAASITKYYPISSTLDDEPTESNTKSIQLVPGTYRNLAININDNTNTNSVTYRFRKNGANGNQNIVLAAGATGYFEDTANTDSVVVNDLVDISFTTGAATVSFTPTEVAVDFVSTNYAMEFVSGRPFGSAYGNAITRNEQISGTFGFDTTVETKAQNIVRLPYGAIFYNLTMFITPNTMTNTTSFTFRKNAAAGNQSLQIASGATGYFTDNTHSDVAVNGDLVHVQLITPAGSAESINIRGMYMLATRLTGYTASLPVSETLTLAEAKVRKPIRPVAEALSLVESILRKAIRPKAETLTLTEAKTRKVIRNKSETLTLAESIARKITRTKAETLTLTEATTRKVIRPKSETLGLAESILRKVIRNKSETLTLSESITRKVGRFKSETLTLSESILRKPIRKVSESIGLSEAISRTAYHFRNIPETLGLAESITRKPIRRVSESITLSESISRKVIRKVSESLGLAESIVRKVIRNKSETISLSESILRKPIRQIQESLTLTESITRKVIRKISETLTLAEVVIVGGARFFSYAINETLTLTESITRKPIRNISESLNLSENIKRKVSHFVSESLSLAESISRRFKVSIAENVTLSESVSRKVGRFVNETLGLSESTVRKVNRRIAETITLAESIAANFIAGLQKTFYIFSAFFSDDKES